MRAALAAIGVAAVDGIVFDLGVSSFQLDQGERGFSFQVDGPLDMRMSRSGPSAADLVQELSEPELARLLFTLGDEPQARSVARAIVKAREVAPLTTTAALAAVVARAKGGRQGPRDPATRTFQALRMAVNDEMGELERGLVAAEALLRPGGRLVVVSFHSGEDGAVKAFVNRHGGRQPQPSRHLPPVAFASPRWRWVKSGVIKPSTDETRRQPTSALGATAGGRTAGGRSRRSFRRRGGRFMAARRVSLGYLASSVLLALGAAAATFQLKYAVRDLEHELAATRARIERERWAIQSARADLEYLIRPDRVVLQASQLGMVEARGGRLASAVQLPDWAQLQWSKAPMSAMLPSGVAVELRAKPMALSLDLDLGPD